MELPTALEAMRPTFRALAQTIVPRATELSEPEWSELEAIVADAMAQRPAAVRRQLLLFIRLANLLPVVRWGRTFRRLDPGRRERYLRALESSPLFLLRRGFWGLRTLIFMGYYGRPAVHAELGYGARLRGWLEHPDAPDAARRRTLSDAGAGRGDGGVGGREGP
jgi:hypothetical protein